MLTTFVVIAIAKGATAPDAFVGECQNEKGEGGIVGGGSIVDCQDNCKGMTITCRQNPTGDQRVEVTASEVKWSGPRYTCANVTQMYCEKSTGKCLNHRATSFDARASFPYLMENKCTPTIDPLTGDITDTVFESQIRKIVEEARAKGAQQIKDQTNKFAEALNRTFAEMNLNPFVFKSDKNEIQIRLPRHCPPIPEITIPKPVELCLKAKLYARQSSENIAEIDGQLVSSKLKDKVTSDYKNFEMLGRYRKVGRPFDVFKSHAQRDPTFACFTEKNNNIEFSLESTCWQSGLMEKYKIDFHKELVKILDSMIESLYEIYPPKKCTLYCVYYWNVNQWSKYQNLSSNYEPICDSSEHKAMNAIANIKNSTTHHQLKDQHLKVECSIWGKDKNQGGWVHNYHGNLDQSSSSSVVESGQWSFEDFKIKFTWESKMSRESYLQIGKRTEQCENLYPLNIHQPLITECGQKLYRKQTVNGSTESKDVVLYCGDADYGWCIHQNDDINQKGKCVSKLTSTSIMIEGASYSDIEFKCRPYFGSTDQVLKFNTTDEARQVWLENNLGKVGLGCLDNLTMRSKDPTVMGHFCGEVECQSGAIYCPGEKGFHYCPAYYIDPPEDLVILFF